MKNATKTTGSAPIKKESANKKETLKTEAPLSEKDEVKKAEERTNKKHR